ncbi:unnamed protein product [Bursaphelenchus okinawaensis]|uniref:Uncharacterized protein n=1 Tax=Bursaphelenchus okinawaensis TaxID=465554 RepID=A0A811KXK3_9BILA|nr:unnamed protein product [Bursaphelenchus okinawaensis]CAG9112697.1 unnamed protein product [Bursaphelenchus okinawaensis]
MAGRGRPKRGLMPNIAAAGRTIKTEPVSEATSLAPVRGRGRGRAEGRGRGRGAAERGRGAARGGRAHIIESEAIFTAGLDEGSLKSKRGEALGAEKIVGKIEKGENLNGFIDDSEDFKDKKVKKNGFVKKESTLPTYELEWMSDDECDKEELEQIVYDGFISDVKHAKDAPVVLPGRDKEQFLKLLSKKAKKHQKEEPMEIDHAVKAEVLSQCTSEMEFDRISDMGLREAGDYVKDFLKGTSRDFLLVQLPLSLSHFKDSVVKPKEEAPEVVKTEDFGFSKEEPAKTEDKPKVSHCLDGIPSNAQIGTVQILKNGQTRFMIGGKPIEIRSAIPSNLCEAIVNVDVNVQSKTDSELRYLGGVEHSVLCSYNYNRLLKRP